MILLPEKVQTIKHIVVPTNKKHLRSFIGVINYYRDMWKNRSDILTPLTKMTSIQATWNWTKETHKAFEYINNVFLEKPYAYIVILVNCLYFITVFNSHGRPQGATWGSN